MRTNRRHDDAARHDRPGLLPASIQVRIRALAIREDHERFLDRMNSDGGIISDRYLSEEEDSEADEESA